MLPFGIFSPWSWLFASGCFSDGVPAPFPGSGVRDVGSDDAIAAPPFAAVVLLLMVGGCAVGVGNRGGGGAGSVAFAPADVALDVIAVPVDPAASSRLFLVVPLFCSPALEVACALLRPLAEALVAMEGCFVSPGPETSVSILLLALSTIF